jgi:hypothetical protein
MCILWGMSNKKGAYCYAPNPDPDDPDPDDPDPESPTPKGRAEALLITNPPPTLRLGDALLKNESLHKPPRLHLFRFSLQNH